MAVARRSDLCTTPTGPSRSPPLAETREEYEKTHCIHCDLTITVSVGYSDTSSRGTLLFNPLGQVFNHRIDFWIDCYRSGLRETLESNSAYSCDIEAKTHARTAVWKRHRIQKATSPTAASLRWKLYIINLPSSSASPSATYSKWLALNPGKQCLRREGISRICSAYHRSSLAPDSSA